MPGGDGTKTGSSSPKPSPGANYLNGTSPVPTPASHQRPCGGRLCREITISQPGVEFKSAIGLLFITQA